MTTIVTVHGTNAGDESDSGDQWWQQGSEFQEKLSEYVETPDGRLEFKPFHWGVGPNSELKRRDAGNDLRRTMLELERENEPYSVIGHSHGGSVLNHALFSVYAKKLKLPNLRNWITVGTPYINMGRSGLFLNRFNNPGKIGLLITFFFLYVFLTVSVSIFENVLNEPRNEDLSAGVVSSSTHPVQLTAGANSDPMPPQEEEEVKDPPKELEVIVVTATKRESNPLIRIGSIALFFTVLSGVAVWAYTLRSRKRNSDKFQRSFVSTFRPKWTGFYHDKDEAIFGLNSANNIKLKLFSTRGVTQSTASFLALLISFLTIFTLCIEETAYRQAAYEAEDGTCQSDIGVFSRVVCSELISTVRENAEVSGDLAFDISENQLYGYEREFEDQDLNIGQKFSFLLSYISNVIYYPFDLIYDAGIDTNILETLLPIPLLVMFMAFSAYAFTFVFLLPVIFVLVKLTNRQITRSAKNGAFGADAYGESVRNISTAFGATKMEAHKLPDEACREIEEYTETFAIDAIRRIRSLISSNVSNLNNPITDQISDTLSWKELIHTAYFDVDNFIKLVAVSLCDAGLVTPSEKLTSDPEYAKVVGWYREMKPQIVQQAS